MTVYVAHKYKRVVHSTLSEQSIYTSSTSYQREIVPTPSLKVMSLLHNSNAQSSGASTSDSSSLRHRAVHEESVDDDSSVFNVIGDFYSTPSAMDSQTDLPEFSEQDMSETRLRQMYDEEEIERFLYLFSAVSPCLACHWIIYPEELQVCHGSETTRCSG